MATIPGTKVVLRGKEYTVAPLSFGAVRRFTLDGTFEKAGSWTSGFPTVEQSDAVVRMFVAALAANHPEVTEDDVLNALDLGNYQTVLNAVLGVSKLLDPSPNV